MLKKLFEISEITKYINWQKSNLIHFVSFSYIMNCLQNRLHSNFKFNQLINNSSIISIKLNYKFFFC